MRRPSPALVVALLALFVALDGPAAAQRLLDGKLLRKGSVTSRAVKDRTLALRDLSSRARRELEDVEDTTITEAKLANGAVTPGKLAPGAVGSPAIADRSVGGVDLAPGAVAGVAIADGAVTGADVGDGSLGAQDIARFQGRFRLIHGIPAIPPFACWAAVPTDLAPQRAGADISQDLVLVTPGAQWPEERLTLTVSADGQPDRFVLSVCNVTPVPSPPFDAGFRYAVVDMP